MLPHQEKIPYNRTKNTPKKHQRTPTNPPKVHFISQKNGCKIATKLHERNERE
jgi:hypothetical protein